MKKKTKRTIWYLLGSLTAASVAALVHGLSQ